MTVFLAYLVALLITCLYLYWYGGRTGLWSGAVLLSMALISAALALTEHNYVVLQPRMLLCDTVSLALKFAIALKSRRRWPIWVAAFQLNTVLASSAIMLAPAFRNDFYYAMATIWAVPTLVVMVVGTKLDRRYDTKWGHAGHATAS
ncbi:MAG: hypothetical protein LKF30_01465 [Sphingobium sp.]|nr:hypothetical protein [Sphingobium sp.]MCI1271244.1 hypothetical protein [Sphingobium sp.]MCI1756064.1 hypothetical protein [Sphingobium sp.]MCI2052639.1 hypothetical protein [Sphingobium sp.]